MSHKFSLGSVKRENSRWKVDLKPYFEDGHLENLRENPFRKGEDDAPTDAHDDEHANDLPRSKYV